MDRIAVKSTLLALLLLSAASISVQQSATPGAKSSTPVLESPNQGENSGLPASQGVPVSPPPALGDSSLLATPPPSAPANNSLRSPPPQLPLPSSGYAPGVPAPGSTPPPPIQIPKEPPRGDEKEKDDGGGILTARDDEVKRCDEKGIKCGDNLVFCLLEPPKDLKKNHVVVHNQGKNPLNVSIVNTSAEVFTYVTLGSDESKKIELAADTALNYEVQLDNGKKRCPLSAVPPPELSLSMLQQLPAYASRLSPVYAAYGILFTALLAGGTCAWCRFRRRARHVDARIPYQQLEMGTQTQPSYATDTSNAVDTVQGWEQGWDDDWDDEEAAAGPPHGMAAASSNSAAKTKSSTKDGWEDWDD